MATDGVLVARLPAVCGGTFLFLPEYREAKPVLYSEQEFPVPQIQAERLAGEHPEPVTRPLPGTLATQLSLAHYWTEGVAWKSLCDNSVSIRADIQS